MVATKKSPLQEGNFDVRRGGGSSSSVTESRLNLTGELGGVIFICNNDTMDLERGLFEGLPQRYQDLVRAIQPGMPLFLYNYSTRKLYGVYEAASNGALNIEPDAWAESRDSARNGKPVSKYPAQVRMRLRQERPPLEEDKFRPYLRHYEYPKFKLDLTPEEVTLELTREEAENLLRLFGMDEENGGGWQTVRGNKPNRSHHVPINPQSGRRRPAPVPNGAGANGSPALTGLVNSAIDGVTRPGSRADTAHRWRTDSDSWSGSSSAGTVSSSWTLHEEERPKKSYVANGVIADAVGSVSGEEKGQDARVRRMEHVNGNSEVDRETEAGTSFVEGTYSNGVECNAVSNSAVRGSSSKPGFASYSAAVKAGIPTGAIENSGWEPLAGSSTDSDAAPSGSRTDNGKPSSTLSTDVSSSENLADKNQKSSANGSSRSPKGDVQGIWVAHSKQKAENGPRRSEELSSRQQAGAGAGLDDERTSCSDGDLKKSDRAQPWSKPGALPKSLASDFGNRNGGLLDSQRPTSQVPSDLLIAHKAEQNDHDKAELATMDEQEDVEISYSKGTSRKVGYQSKDAHGRLQDMNPGVCSAVMNGGSAGHKEKLEPDGTYLAVHGGDAENERTPSAMEVGSQKQQGHPSEQPGPATSSHGSKPQSYFQHSRPTHEVRRSQFEYQKHERHLEDRPGHYRKQLPVDHSQIPPVSQARQHGHNLAPIRVPTSPPPLMHQHHLYPLLPTTNAAAHIYRERSHGRGIRAVSGPGEGVQVQAYRPISARGGLDGDMGVLSPISPASAGTIAVSPVPPSPASSWTLPSQILSPTFAVPGYPPFHVPHLPTVGIHPNVEILHSEILEFARSATLTAEARRRALAAVDCVRKGVKQLWEDADVEMFGSFSTGLCLCHSDVDVVVLNTPPPSVYDIETYAQGGVTRALIPLVRDLAAALQPSDWCLSLETIETATVPVMHLWCLPDGKATDTNTPVKIDITIGGRSKGSSDIPAGLTSTQKANYEKFFEPARKHHNGLPTRDYVIQRLRQLPALAPLVLLLKSYLHKRGLNVVYTGGLGSFSLTLMLIFYLERVPPFCGMRQELAGSSFASGQASADTHSASSCDEVDEADDNISTSSYCSTSTSASSSSNEGTAMSGDSNSAASSRTIEGHMSGDNLQGSAGGSFEELWALMQTVPAPTLGVLLLGFLRMFESIDLSKVKFVLKGNGSEGGVYPSNPNCNLWIDDPLRPGTNIGASSFNVRLVQRAMGDMLTILTQVPTLNGTERAGMGPGRRRPLVLLDQLFAHSGPSLS